MQTELFQIHEAENNAESQQNLLENRIKFSKQCHKVFEILMAGNSLSVFDAVTAHKINSLPRRILDLRENGVQISNTWITVARMKLYFMTKEQREFNKKFYDRS